MWYSSESLHGYSSFQNLQCPSPEAVLAEPMEPECGFLIYMSFLRTTDLTTDRQARCFEQPVLHVSVSDELVVIIARYIGASSDRHCYIPSSVSCRNVLRPSVVLRSFAKGRRWTRFCKKGRRNVVPNSSYPQA
jgi:hypothetical protein